MPCKKVTGDLVDGLNRIYNMKMKAKAKVKERKGTSGHGAGKRAGELFKFSPYDYVIVGVDTKDGPEHRLYDERNNQSVSARLLNSVRRYGVLKPIFFERDGDQVLVNDGRQRMRCARIIWDEQKDEGVPKDERIQVRGLPFRGDDAELAGASAAANIHVEDGDPMISAKKAQRLMRYIHSEDEVATAMGVTVQTVKQWLSSLGLAPEVRAAIRGGKLSATAGTTLARLPKAQQAAKVAELTAGGVKPTVQEAANEVRAARGKAPLVTAKGKLSMIETEIRKLYESSKDPDRMRHELQESDLDMLVDALVRISQILAGSRTNGSTTWDESRVESTHVGGGIHDSPTG